MSNRIRIHMLQLELHRALDEWHNPRANDSAPKSLVERWEKIFRIATQLKEAKAQQEMPGERVD